MCLEVAFLIRYAREEWLVEFFLGVEVIGAVVGDAVSFNLVRSVGGCNW